MKELNIRLTQEKAKLQRLIERGRVAALAAREARGIFAGLESGLESAQAQAVLAEKPWPSPEAEKKLGPARAAVANAEKECDAIEKGCATQSEIIREVEGEIEASRQAACLAELGPCRDRINKLIGQLGGEIANALEIGGRHRAPGYDFGLLLFPPESPLLPEDRTTYVLEVAARMGIFNSVRQLAALLAQSGRSI
jgi:hypothetical protein